MASSELWFTGSYLEEVFLDDGTSVSLRTVCPSDKDLLRRGFERLSPESRYFRFFASKLRLSDEELRRLTEIDGIDHVAIGAVMKREDGNEDGLGVARFIRVKGEPEVAEPAIAVVDDFQGKGLGTLLLHRLSGAALERGIKRFRCEILADNDRMKSVLSEVSSDFWFAQPINGVMEVEFEIPQAALKKARVNALRKSDMGRLLSHAARKTVSIGLGRRLLKHLAEKKRPISVGVE